MKTAVSLVAMAFVLGIAAGCAPEPPLPGGDEMAEGCYDTDGYLDIYYNGPIDTVSNADEFPSTDGSCSGAVNPGASTVVRAADRNAADQKCIDLGYTTAGTMGEIVDPAPEDSYLCFLI